MPGVLRARSLACSFEKSIRVSHRKCAETIRHSLRNGLRLIRALPGVPGLLAPVPRARDPGLDPSVGGSGPHDFAVREGAFVRRGNRAETSSRPSHPASHVRDDREAPLQRKRDGRQTTIFLRKTEAKYFRKAGLTLLLIRRIEPLICPSGELTAAA
jgi:hypothetical protein